MLVSEYCFIFLLKSCCLFIRLILFLPGYELRATPIHVITIQLSLVSSLPLNSMQNSWAATVKHRWRSCCSYSAYLRKERDFCKLSHRIHFPRINQCKNTILGCIGSNISWDHWKIILHRNSPTVTMALEIWEWGICSFLRL